MQALDRPLRRLNLERAAIALIEAKRSTHTKKAYRADLERWLRFCYASGINPERPNIEDTTAFRDYLLAALSAGSARRCLAALSSIYKGLLAGRIAASNAFHRAILAWPPASNVGKTAAVTEEVAKAMIAEAGKDTTLAGVRDAAILRVLYDTGLRRESVATIKRLGVKVDHLLVTVKGSREEEVSIPKETHQAIKRWLERATASPYLFPGRRGGSINTSSINKIVKQRAEAVGAVDIHPHCFRAAFVTEAYDLELPEHEIRDSVHHRDTTMTRRYDRRTRGRGVAEALATKRRG